MLGFGADEEDGEGIWERERAGSAAHLPCVSCAPVGVLEATSGFTRYSDGALSRRRRTTVGAGDDEGGSEDAVSTVGEPTEAKRCVGLCLILVGILVFGSIGILVKKMEEDSFPFLQVSFVRYVNTSTSSSV